jgi:hypothetical protein
MYILLKRILGILIPKNGNVKSQKKLLSVFIHEVDY